MINYFNMSIYPSMLAENNLELKIHITTDKGCYGSTHIYSVSEFESLFDVIFDFTKNTFKNKIREAENTNTKLALVKKLY